MELGKGLELMGTRVMSMAMGGVDQEFGVVCYIWVQGCSIAEAVVRSVVVCSGNVGRVGEESDVPR